VNNLTSLERQNQLFLSVLLFGDAALLLTVLRALASALGTVYYYLYKKILRIEAWQFLYILVETLEFNSEGVFQLTRIP
jgi:hypothetical protein